MGFLNVFACCAQFAQFLVDKADYCRHFVLENNFDHRRSVGDAAN